MMRASLSLTALLGLVLAAAPAAAAPSPWIAAFGSCCNLCCCGLIDVDANKPPEDEPKAEVPPAAPAPAAPVSSSAPAVAASGGVTPLALASLAAGRIDEVIVQLADDDPFAQRLSAVRKELGRGADPRTAVFRVYGAQWATRPERPEILALLAGRDEKFRWRLSSLAHADVKTEWPNGTETAAADALRVELRRALPEGADDDGARGFLLTHRLRVRENDKKNALIENTQMRSWELAFDVTLTSIDGAEIAHYTDSTNVLAISQATAVQSFLTGGRGTETLRGVVDNLVGHLLTDAEVSARKSAA